jgi:uncharacterized membrane protein
MTTYELLTFLHISAAIIWLGAGFLLGVLIFGAARAGDRGREAGYHRDVGWLAPRVFVPGSLATFIFGVLLTIDGDWDFGSLWITVAMIGWLASFLTGILYFKPEGQRIGALAAERGPGDPEIEARVHRVNIIDRVQLAVLFTVVADMVIKPTGDDTGVLIAGAVVLAGALALAAAMISGGAQARADAGASTDPLP